MTVERALKHKGLEFETVELRAGAHTEAMAEIYGEGKTTVPGVVIDGEPVHGSVAILERLEQIAPDPSLYPEPIADAVHEAERWGDAELQDLGRRLPWGSLHFRPEAMGTFAGGEPLDPAGTDFAMKFLHGAWKYHKISCAVLATDLAGLPAKLDQIDRYAADGVIGGDQPTAADLQIGATVNALMTVGDLDELLADRPARQVALNWFPERTGKVPAGAFPAGWVPSR